MIFGEFRCEEAEGVTLAHTLNLGAKTLKKGRVLTADDIVLLKAAGIATNLYYSWSKEFLEAGKSRLLGDTQRQATSREVGELRTEVDQLKHLVAELSLKNRVLQKNLRGQE